MLRNVVDVTEGNAFGKLWLFRRGAIVVLENRVLLVKELWMWFLRNYVMLMFWSKAIVIKRVKLGLFL